jgi:hypothetical protein
MMQTATCGRRYCGARLELIIDKRTGAVAAVCPLCAINKQGRCRSRACYGRLTASNAMYCKACSAARWKKANCASQLRRYHDPSTGVRRSHLERHAERWATDPDYVAHRREYLANWQLEQKRAVLRRAGRGA